VGGAVGRAFGNRAVGTMSAAVSYRGKEIKSAMLWRRGWARVGKKPQAPPGPRRPWGALAPSGSVPGPGGDSGVRQCSWAPSGGGRMSTRGPRTTFRVGGKGVWGTGLVYVFSSWAGKGGLVFEGQEGIPSIGFFWSENAPKNVGRVGWPGIRHFPGEPPQGLVGEVWGPGCFRAVGGESRRSGGLVAGKSPQKAGGGPGI